MKRFTRIVLLTTFAIFDFGVGFGIGCIQQLKLQGVSIPEGIKANIEATKEAITKLTSET